MKVLIDNSTITAAFRAAGKIEMNNRELFDLDVASLRVLVDTLVLADEIAVLDNYKQEYSAERKLWLNHSDIFFHEIDDKLDKKMIKDARAHVSNWKMTQHLGTELSRLFDDISIMFKHAWRHSESFLVLKALGVEDKYGSSITKALRDNLYGRSAEMDKFIDKSLKSYNKETSKVAQSMIWASIRTVYYREASKHLGAEYSPHPLRNLYNTKCILFDNHPYTRKYKLHSNKIIDPRKAKTREECIIMYEEISKGESYYSELNSFFSQFWTECNEKDDNVFGVQTYDVDMPPFLAFVLNRASGSKDIMDAIFKLREAKEVVALRNKLRFIHQECLDDNQAKHIREFAIEMRDLKSYMQRYLGYDREKVGVSVKMLSYDMTVPRFMTKPLYPHKPHLAIIRDVVLELASASTMGRMVDKLWYERKF
ncbi:hypothetical protein [Tindallia californiensis]|uniref:Uncharacterized protein n=1 Tax=Tindallia californiensis TaxID=159292 RepID=A0A1H3PR11_9FIRM|nr:hypothetical protein [Tindallia californiensis]SDZ03401.1 hypothetical protein SAMN05192546_10733 [Tindallia californiensis]